MEKRVFEDGSPDIEERYIVFNLLSIKPQRVYISLGAPMTLAHVTDLAEKSQQVQAAQRSVKEAVERGIQYCLFLQASHPNRFFFILGWGLGWVWRVLGLERREKSVGFANLKRVPGSPSK
jgi:hypothetical protein